MLHKFVEHKVCPLCNVDKPSSAYAVDKARVDGLRFCCDDCWPNYTPKRSRQDLSAVEKICGGCGRTLNARAFFYSQHSKDKLTNKCRTCRSSKAPFTVDDAIAFEVAMCEIILNAVDDCGGINEHRAEFDELVVSGMEAAGLLDKWNPPVWIGKL
jgi:hypothetical protein